MAKNIMQRIKCHGRSPICQPVFAMLLSAALLTTNVTAQQTIVQPTAAQPTRASQPTAQRSAVTATSKLSMVATVNPIATDAGVAALDAGGNAVDAAIAAALTLGVVDGFNSGIGGGCFILIRTADGKIMAMDGREMAPQAASRDMYIRNGKADGKLSQIGALASGCSRSTGGLRACCPRTWKAGIFSADLAGGRHCGAKVSRSVQNTRKSCRISVQLLRGDPGASQHFAEIFVWQRWSIDKFTGREKFSSKRTWLALTGRISKAGNKMVLQRRICSANRRSG